MRSILWALAGCTFLACGLPAKAAMVVPAVMVAPVAAPDKAETSPLLQNVWWDRWHHWHHRHWWHHHGHHYPR